MYFLSVIGDGSLVRAALEVLVDFLKRFAAPTGARGSVLFMWGGLIIIGFLFLTFLFRSAIVGDLAPVANGRTLAPRTLMPGQPVVARLAPTRPPRLSAASSRPFEQGRAHAREIATTLDGTLAAMHAGGVDARILLSDERHKRLRVYACLSCGTATTPGDPDADRCEYERGLVAGAFEELTGGLVKVEEVSCRRRGDSHCEFDVRHEPLARAIA